MDGTLTGTTTLGQSRSVINSNERVLFTPQSSGSRDSWVDSVQCQTQETHLGSGVLSFCWVAGYCQCILTGPTAFEFVKSKQVFFTFSFIKYWLKLQRLNLKSEKSQCYNLLTHLSIILDQTEMTSICTRLQRMIVAENLTSSEGYESTRHAGANDVILLPENVNQMMGLWIVVWRCPWCNGYRRRGMDTATRVQILDWLHFT